MPLEELSLKTYSRSLSEFLDNDLEFHIPNHQRDYKWDIENVEQFIEDVIDSQRANSQRFFGTILLSKSALGKHRTQTRKYIVDGQQRFTTSLLTIVVLTHLARELGGTALQLAGLIGSRLNPQGLEPRCRMYANRRNFEFLKRLLVDSSLIRSSVQDAFKNLSVSDRRACRKMYEAYEVIYAMIVSDIGKLVYNLGEVPQVTTHSLTLQYLTQTHQKLEPSQDHLKSFFTHFIYNSIFIEIEIDSWEESFRLFDGLNNRGLDLAQQDILKNVILSRVANSGKSQDEAEALTNWNELEALLEATSFPNFLRHVQLLTEPDVSLQRATTNFIAQTKDADALSTLKELKKTAGIYRMMDFPDEHPNNEISSILKDLRTMGATRIRPIILAALLKQFKPPKTLQLLRALENLYFRRSTICQQDNKSLERTVQEIASDLYSKGESGVADAIFKIKKATPSDEVFVPMFENKTGLKADVARYLLLKIENHLKFSSNPNSGLGISGGTLEHIHPKKPGDGWQGVLDDSEMEEIIQSIGNLTIFAQKENSKASNRSFDEKKEIYKSSGECLKINSDVLLKESWGKPEIIERQRLLAQKAKLVWTGPTSSGE